MITIKEYAEQRGVSHQAVYKQLQTHAAELKNYIVKNGRTRYLTEEAVAILEQYRETSPQIIERANDHEKIEELENQIKKLLSEKSGLETELRGALKWKAEKAVEIAAAEQQQLLLEEKTKKVEVLESGFQEAKKEADEYHLKCQQLQAELERERARKLTWTEAWKRVRGRKES